MTATLADPSLWYGLALKITMTASIVVVASVVVERSGPFIGSLIAALPTAGGAAMIILALEHTPQFIAQSAVGSSPMPPARCSRSAMPRWRKSTRCGSALAAHFWSGLSPCFCCGSWIGAPPAPSY
jgi:hypothetical protein